MLRQALVQDERVLEALAEGIVLQDATGTILACNQSARRILKLDEENIVGKRSEDPQWHAIREDGTDFPGLEHPAMVTLRTGEPLRNIVMGLRAHDGKTTWLTINSQPLFESGSEKPTAVICSFSDITQFVESKREQQESEARWRAIFDNSMDGAMLTMPDGAIIEVNRAGCELLGRSRDEILQYGRALLVDTTDPRLRLALEQRARTGYFRSELTLIRADGSKFPAEVSSVVFDDGTGAKRTSLFFRDVSDRKEVERAKDEFVSTVSHELRTPLASLYGALRLLEGGVLGGLSEEAIEVIQIARANAERLKALINDLLDVECIDSGNLSLNLIDVPVKSAVQWAIDLTDSLARERGILVQATVLDSGTMWADIGRLGQVLVNLLSNAIKFSPEKAIVDVIADEGKEGRVRIRIIDRGPGIPPDFMGRIFGRFQQVDASASREKGGTGLGLAISKSIVKQHGGEIGVESELGRGSCFWLEIPRSGRRSAAEAS